MNSSLVKFSDFQGIVESVASPDPNTFEELLNLRNDRKLGGLANRYGFKTILDIAYQPDAFAYTRFTNHSNDSLVIASATKIEDVENGVTTDLTTAIANNTIGSLGIVSNRCVINLGTALANDPLYNIVYNITRQQYAVVTDRVIGPPSSITINLNVVTGIVYPLLWVAGDQLQFFKNDLLIGITGFTRTLIGSPLLETIDAYNNLLLLGIKEDSSQSSLWIGQISNRKYFGPPYDSAISTNSVGFTKDGLYVTRLMEDFTSGAFRSILHHIATRVDSVLVTTVSLSPTSDFSVTGNWTPSYNLYASVNETTGAHARSINSHHGSTNQVIFGFAPFTSPLKPNRNGYVNFQMDFDGPDWPTYQVFLIEAVEFVSGVPVVRGAMVQFIQGGNWNVCVIWCK